jgi:sigma-B regulation protein RsbU (phosphoserine phosphatase)
MTAGAGMTDAPRQDDLRGKAARYALIGGLLLILLPIVLALLPKRPLIPMLTLGLAVFAVVGTAALFLLRGARAAYSRIADAASDLQSRHDTLEALHKRMQADLRTARGIQRAFLPDPRRRPFPAQIAFAHSFRPEIDVGGDYYDFKPLDAHRLALLLADVSGHGMSAAFVTGLIKTAFEFQNPSVESPSAFMAHLNNVLERLTPSHLFASVFYGIYDVETHVLRYANAGHSPIPIVIRADKSLKYLDSPVDLLAGVNPEMQYQEGEVRLDRGDKLLLCTDGITDSVAPNGERFGHERFSDLLRGNAGLSADALRNAVTQAVIAHEGGGEQSDDQTLIIMEIRR